VPRPTKDPAAATGSPGIAGQPDTVAPKRSGRPPGPDIGALRERFQNAAATSSRGAPPEQVRQSLEELRGVRSELASLREGESAHIGDIDTMRSRIQGAIRSIDASEVTAAASFGTAAMTEGGPTSTVASAGLTRIGEGSIRRAAELRAELPALKEDLATLEQDRAVASSRLEAVERLLVSCDEHMEGLQGAGGH
jgi:hypothetical protein